MRISDWSSDVCSSDLDQVDDVLIEKGFKIGAPRQTELAQRLLTNGNGLADPLLWLCALRSSFFGRLSLGFGDVQRHCQMVPLPRLQPWRQRAHPTVRKDRAIHPTRDPEAHQNRKIVG